MTFQDSETFYSLIKKSKNSAKNLPTIDYYYNMRRLPVDVLRIVLEYYAVSWKRIFLFRALNKEWKDLAESSVAWLRLSWKISPSQEYCINYEKCWSISFYMDAISKETIQYKLFDNPHSFVRFNIDRVVYEHPADIGSIDCVHSPKRVYLWFRTILIFHKNIWETQLRRMKWISYLEGLMYHSVVTTLSFWLYVCSNALFLLSLYGFYSLQSNVESNSPLSARNHLSFFCIEVNILIYMFRFTFDLVRCMIRASYNPQFVVTGSLKAIRLKAGDEFAICFSGLVFLTVTLIHLSLCQQINFEWLHLVIPWWAAVLFQLQFAHSLQEWSFFQRTPEDGNVLKFLVLPLCLFCFMFTMVCEALDGRWTSRTVFYTLSPFVALLVFTVGLHVLGVMEEMRQSSNSMKTTTRRRTVLLVTELISAIMICILTARMSFCACFPKVWITGWLGSGFPPVFLLSLFFFFAHLNISLVLIKAQSN
jgi:hypothetical protein